LSYGGHKTGIVYGFLSKILSIGQRFKTNDFIFCWDAGVSYRHQSLPQYKMRRWQKREEMSDTDKKEYESLLLQMMQLGHAVLPRLGFQNNFIQLHYEADDLLAHWVNRLAPKKRRLVMVTTDADMFQCLDKCDIWLPSRGGRLFTRKDFEEKYKVEPSQWAMAKAIGGCSGDGVPGIEGVSDPKSPSSKALKYLNGELPKGKILERIESIEGKSIIERNFPLVCLPYREDLMKRMIRRRNIFTKGRFIKQFDKLRFESFLSKKNFMKWQQTFLEET
jgi:DNA polymerase-1